MSVLVHFNNLSNLTNFSYPNECRLYSSFFNEDCTYNILIVFIFSIFIVLISRYMPQMQILLYFLRPHTMLHSQRTQRYTQQCLVLSLQTQI